MPDLFSIARGVDMIIEELMAIIAWVLIALGLWLGWRFGGYFTVLGVFCLYTPLAAGIAFGLTRLSESLERASSRDFRAEPVYNLLDRALYAAFFTLCVSTCGALLRTLWDNRLAVWHTITHTTLAQVWHLFIR